MPITFKNAKRRQNIQNTPLKSCTKQLQLYFTTLLGKYVEKCCSLIKHNLPKGIIKKTHLQKNKNKCIENKLKHHRTSESQKSEEDCRRLRHHEQVLAKPRYIFYYTQKLNIRKKHRNYLFHILKQF